MDNSDQSITASVATMPIKVSWTLLSVIILVVIAIGIAWQFTGSKPAPVATQKTIPVLNKVPEATGVDIAELLAAKPVIDEPEVVPATPQSIVTPRLSLDESDDWLKIKLPEITWRKELLSLIIDEHMIRRFVVFTDNFSQGLIAYEYSPFVLPKIQFTPETNSVSFQNAVLGHSSLYNKQNVWQWNESSTKRFSLYVDLLRSMDSEQLVQWYLDVKPLIDEVYQELGYEDDFTETLQYAITRVLDMKLPKSSMALIQPSVMYKFANPKLEALPDTDKLLLRLGKDNLLVIKSVLLEFYEKLAQQQNAAH